VTLSGNTTAQIFGTASAGDDILVHAHLEEDVRDKGLGGQAGFVGLGAAVAVLNDSSRQTASLGDTAAILQADTLTVTAEADLSQNVLTGQAALGVGAAGAAIATITDTGTTVASIGTATIGRMANQSVGDVTVLSDSQRSSVIDAVAVTAGIVAGNGTYAVADIRPTLTASIADGANIQTTRNVNVDTHSAATSLSKGQGVSLAAGAVGVEFAKITLNPTIDTFVGAATLDVRGDLRVRSSHNDNTLTFDANADINDAADTIRFAAAHGLQTGEPVIYLTGGTPAVTGLNDRTTYYAVVVDATTIRLAESYRNAVAASPSVVDIASTGSSFVVNQRLLQGVRADASAGSGGLAAINGVDVEVVSSPVVTTYVGGTAAATSAQINVSGTADVVSSVQNHAFADASGLTIGLGLGVGVVTGAATASGMTNTSLQNGTFDVNNLNVVTTATNSSAVKGQASGGGIISGQGATGTATASPVSNASASGGATLRVTGDLQIATQVFDTAQADLRAASGGLVGIGTTSATATLGGSSTAQLDGRVLDAGNLSVKAISEHTALADGESASVGLAAGVGVDVTATVTPTTRAVVPGTSDGFDTRGNVEIIASSLDNVRVRGGGAVGGFIGAGAVRTMATSNGITEARLDAQATAIAAGSLTVLATNTTLIDNLAQGRGAGFFQGASVSATSLSAPTVTALIAGRSGSPIQVGNLAQRTGDATVQAIASGNIVAAADEVGGGFGTGGVATGLAEWNPTVNSSITADTELTAGGDVSILAHNNHDEAGNVQSGNEVRANGQSKGGGVGGGRTASGTAKTNTTVAALLGGNSTIQAGQTVNVKAKSRNHPVAIGEAELLAAGGSASANSLIEVRSNTTATTDPGLTTVTAAGMNVTSDSDLRFDANGIANGFSIGGIVAGVANVAVQIFAPVTRALVGAGNTIQVPGGTLAVLANSVKTGEAKYSGVFTLIAPIPFSGQGTVNVNVNGAIQTVAQVDGQVPQASNVQIISHDPLDFSAEADRDRSGWHDG
jgi:hypothetical protein